MTINVSKATPAQVAATRHLPGVTRAAGPYPETYILYGELPAGSSPAPSAGVSLPPGVRTENLPSRFRAAAKTTTPPGSPRPAPVHSGS